MKSKPIYNRRSFLSNTALAGAGVLGFPAIIHSCSGSADRGIMPLRPFEELFIPELPDKAIEGKPLKAALVGCGARGTGAAFNFLDAGDNLLITACADLFKDKLDACLKMLKEKKKMEVPPENCFTGFDAYKKVCDLPVDLIIIASPNCFHPEQMKYAIEKGKHVFVEKPAAIDPTGYRTFLASARQAYSRGLNVLPGTQYRFDRPFVASYRKIQEGWIGSIVSGYVFYHTGSDQYIVRQPGWSDMEYMIRGHFNWSWVNGDQVSNMLIHWIDVFNWFSHLKPVRAISYGSRIQKNIGNVYDNFSMNIEYEGGVNVSGMVRRIDGCDNDRGAIIRGEKGSWHSRDFSIRNNDGEIIWKYDGEDAKNKFKVHDMYTLEHIELVNHIRKGKVINVAEGAAISSMTAVMARESAYTGKAYTWEQITSSNLNMLPEKMELINMDLKKYEIPLAGISSKNIPS
ncbi:MAG: Gfo/Idh/MocA family oxidoreductase [Bacteroidales bacterium]|jgi:predicted dehydrogenase|nr:Gfo/Idh/MocA family oxidoreductase [Bacteroidales bacterium]